MLLLAGVGWKPIADLRRRRALKALSEIHTRGLNLRNVGLSVTTSAQLTSFVAERDERWLPLAKIAVSRVNRNESEMFEKLGDISADILPGVAYISVEHARQVAFLTRWLRRIEDIHRRHSA